MTQHHDATAQAVAAEPNSKNDDNNINDASPREETAVEVRESRQRRRKPSLLSMLSCCGRSSISNSIHFHAQRVEDSVHVIIRHDKEACQRKGQPEKVYSPRKPLSERLEAARKMQQAREAASQRTIEAKEEDGESDDILAAVSLADCVSGGQ